MGIATIAEDMSMLFMLVSAFVVFMAVVGICLFRGVGSALKGAIVTVAVFVALAWTLTYLHGARYRAGIVESQCDREVSPDNRFLALRCLAGRYDVIRLYASDGHRLMAERTFRYQGQKPATYWKGDTFAYDDGESEELATINLPPSLFDRLLARLP